MDRISSDVSARVARDELADLLREVGRKDRGAFANLYQRTAGKLYGICLRLIGNEAEAQETLQEIFLLVWQKADIYDASKASPITWLAVLARNKALDRLRRREVPNEDLAAADQIADESPPVLNLLSDAQDAMRLRHCLDELDERARTMIKAAFLDGASYPQLANTAQVPLGTVKSWIRRGLQRLRGCLER